MAAIAPVNRVIVWNTYSTPTGLKTLTTGVGCSGPDDTNSGLGGTPAWSAMITFGSVGCSVKVWGACSVSTMYSRCLRYALIVKFSTGSFKKKLQAVYSSNSFSSRASAISNALIESTSFSLLYASSKASPTPMMAPAMFRTPRSFETRPVRSAMISAKRSISLQLQFLFFLFQIVENLDS